MNEVMEAWTNPGPVPGYHFAMQDYLRQSWPTLANALDKAAEVYISEKAV